LAENTTERLFDASKIFEVPKLTGEKCKVRFPTDEEWCSRARRHRTVRKTLGRGKSQFLPGNARSVDYELFRKIRVDDDGAEFDEADGAAVVDRLDRAEVVEVERTGTQYRIVMKVPGAKTVHTLRIPSQAQVDDFSAASGSSIHSDRQTEIRIYMDPAAPLYDAIAVHSEGYKGAVPITHKLGALRAMLAELNASIDDTDPEE
jgi:hypothetical protein